MITDDTWTAQDARRRKRTKELVQVARKAGVIPVIEGKFFHHPDYGRPLYGVFVWATDHLRLHAGKIIPELEYRDYWQDGREVYEEYARESARKRITRLQRRWLMMDGNALRDLRKIAGLRQGEVGAELGVNNDTICRWECGAKEIEKVYWEAFERLIRDADRILAIKRGRRRRRVAARSGFRGEDE
jgi:hypothetical protein